MALAAGFKRASAENQQLELQIPEDCRTWVFPEDELFIL
jgi:hypothetical protein